MYINNINNTKQYNFGKFSGKNTDNLKREVAGWLNSKLLSKTEELDLIKYYRILDKFTPNHNIDGTLGNYNKPAVLHFYPTSTESGKYAILKQGALEEISTQNFLQKNFPYSEVNGNGRFACWNICNPVKFLKSAVDMIFDLNINPKIDVNAPLSQIIKQLDS